MIIIGVLGDIGSGKSYVARQFGCPVFNADDEVAKIYRNSKVCFKKLNRLLPKYIKSFPINKNELTNSILKNGKNIIKISKVVHPLVRKKMNSFIIKNKKKRVIILDVPLLLENKIKIKNMILVFVDAKKSDILSRLSKRTGFNKKIFKKLRKIQLPLDYKKRKSHFIIKNNFTNRFVKRDVKYILKKIL